MSIPLPAHPHIPRMSETIATSTTAPTLSMTTSSRASSSPPWTWPSRSAPRTARVTAARARNTVVSASTAASTLASRSRLATVIIAVLVTPRKSAAAATGSASTTQHLFPPKLVPTEYYDAMGWCTNSIPCLLAMGVRSRWDACKVATRQYYPQYVEFTCYTAERLCFGIPLSLTECGFVPTLDGPVFNNDLTCPCLIMSPNP